MNKADTAQAAYELARSAVHGADDPLVVAVRAALTETADDGVISLETEKSMHDALEKAGIK